MSSKKDKLKRQQAAKVQAEKEDILKGIKVRKTEPGEKKTDAKDTSERPKAPGKKNIKSSKFEVSKDEKTGSYCMDPVDKETGKRIAP